jgi:hypothetical protein
MKRINLVSGPRNISTALMYSFAQRSDTVVMDEPFYAVYLLASGADHPGKEDVLRSQPNTEKGVRKQIDSVTGAEVLFVKNMAHHMEVLANPFIDEAINIFLIRDPLHILSSYSKVIEQPVMRDIGIAYQYKLFTELVKQGNKPVVVDSGSVLADPERMLRNLCNACGLGFERGMLHWKSGPKPYDGVWAPYWYSNVHASTGFGTATLSERTLSSSLTALYEQARTIYEKLLPFCLKA